MIRVAVSFIDTDIQHLDGQTHSVLQFGQQSHPINIFCYACGLAVYGRDFWIHAAQPAHHEGNRTRQRACSWDHSPLNAQSPYAQQTAS